MCTAVATTCRRMGARPCQTASFPGVLVWQLQQMFTAVSESLSGKLWSPPCYHQGTRQWGKWIFSVNAFVFWQLLLY